MAPEKKRILVVDDEEDIVELIRYNLTKDGFEVLGARNGKEALAKISPAPDLIILDIMMPVMDGFETCRRLKAQPASARIPVVFLTASSNEVDEVVGLELGADDYIQKPISPRTLVARVKSVLRRTAQPVRDAAAQQEIIAVGNLEINRSTYKVKIGKKEVFFPKKEFEILTLLASHAGRVFTRESLLNTLWGTDVVVIDRTVDVHIRKIREKLGRDADVIETVKGVGYRFQKPQG